MKDMTKGDTAIDEMEVLRECDLLCAHVDEFADEMKKKLCEKAYSGYTGWNDPEFESTIADKLDKHFTRLMVGDKGHSIDVANLVMMLHFLDREVVDENI